MSYFSFFILLCVGICTGCVDRQASTEARNALVKDVVPEESALTTAPTRLSAEETERIIHTVTSAGGVVIRNSSGVIRGIDVARQRTPIDEETARAILQLPQLSVLRLAINSISPATLRQFALQPQLSELLLRDVPLNDSRLAEVLSRLPALERLTLHRAHGITDESLAAVAELDNLQVLALIDAPITGTGLQRLKRRTSLRSLDLRDCTGLQAEDYRVLRDIDSLTGLKLGGPNIDDATIDVVLEIPRLNSLAIEDAPVSAAAIQRLSSGPELAERIRSLVLTRCYGVTDEALSVLVELPNLGTLSIRECPVSGAFLMSLAEVPSERLPPLKTLVIRQAFLSEQAVAVLPQLAANLKWLDLSGTTLSTSSMEAIAKISQLQTLRLAGCSLDDEAIRPIQSLTNLITLDLSDNVGITDKSATIFAKLPKLEHNHLRNTRLTMSHLAPSPAK